MIKFVKTIDTEKLGELYYEEGKFYNIIYKETDIGIAGYCELKDNLCNLNYLIYPEFRNIQTKGLLLEVLNFPKLFNFCGCIMVTAIEKLKRVLLKMNKYGVIYTGIVDNHSCFYIDYVRN